MVVIFGKKKIDEFYKQMSEVKKMVDESKKELIELRKEIEKLKAENEVLKQNTNHNKTLEEKIIELSQVVENGFDDGNERLNASQLLNEWFNGEDK